MRKFSLILAALLAPAAAVLVAAPASAVDHVICVGAPAGVSCDDTVATIQAAITAAGANSVDDTIRVAPGLYSDGPWTLNGNSHQVTLQGSGPSTVLTMPAGPSQTYLSANAAGVRNLRITMTATTADNDTALSAYNGAVVQSVDVDGSNAANATAIQTGQATLSGLSVQILGAGSRAVYGSGAATITDSVLEAPNTFVHSGSGTPDVLSRVTLLAGSTGVSTDVGSVEIDDSVIDLGSTGAVGLQAANFNNSTALRSVTANHVTIVGGSGSSKGAWAYAATPGALQTSTITVANSIVRGQTVSLAADASNNGSQGGSSSAAVAVSYSDYENTGGTIGANGTGGVTPGAGNLNVAPGFAGAGDYHLAVDSPLVDKGDPAAGGPATDRDGNPRVRNLVRDIGAYEYADLVAPQTALLGGPPAATRDTTPTFTFSSEAGATFSCALDAGAFAACASPFTTAALTNGTHTFRVRATDAAANTDATPATRTFRVDTVAPGTRWVKKPAKTVSTRRVTFRFASSEAGSTYVCKLDRGAWRACATPRTFAVKKGTHVFSVRAKDAAGNVDATPATYRFKRK
ncbi:Ig-like domain-containing protein [Marmoricola sp. RAF53]|uniref:Ig-like domain-containing protein n=1 Tax=Marmoricola sp. RAF53 TaxID=3233059 RepID=UPI003F9E6530